MKQKIIIYLFVITGLTGTHWCSAQMIYDTLLLSELEITAFQADFTAATKQHRVDSVFLQNLNHTDLGVVLSSYTPVYIRSYGNGSLATASFRGTGANHTQLMWNDFRINSPMLGQSDLSLVPVSFFDRVELYYGGASLIKSEGGLGGNICLFNQPFSADRPKVYLEQSAGSFNSFSTSAGVNLGEKKFNSDTRFMFQSADNNFSYYNDAIAPPREMVQRNASFKNTGFIQQFNFRPAQHQHISVASWTQWNHRDVPPVMSKAEASQNLNEYEDDFFSRNTVSWELRKNKSKVEVKAAWFYENYSYHQELLNNNGQTDTLINSQNKSHGLFAKSGYSISLNRGFSFSSGIDFYHDRVISNNYTNITKRNTLAAFAQLEKDFLERIKLSLLMRGQLTDEVLLPVMPLLGMNIKLLKDHRLFFRSSLSRNYHLPSLNDLYWQPGGNQNLEPEDGYELEAGFNFIYASGDNFLFKTDLTAYATKVSNWIQWVDTGTGIWSPQNVKQVFSRGVEYTVQAQGGLGKLNYLFYLQYAYTRTTDRSPQAIADGKGEKQLMYIPEHAANAYFKITVHGFFSGWHMHYVGSQNAVGSQLPAFLLNDVSIGKRLQTGRSKFDIRLNAKNIFNIQYQSVLARAMPGRNFEISIKYTLNK